MADIRIPDELVKCQTFNSDLKHDYKAHIPKLPLPASQNQCLDAIDTLKAVYQDETRYNKWKAVYDEISKSTVETIHSLDSTTLHHILFNYSGLQEKLDLIKQWVQSDLESTQSAHFQEALQVMLEGQDEELKKMAMEPFSQHLNRKESTREKLGMRITIGQVPLEIADMIFSYCTLETCVSLRQVSSFWYNVYQDSECLLETKLNERNPWITPEGDMTWGDCSLVYISRISKWKSVTSKDELEFSQKPYTPKILTATPLRYGEKVPDNFSPLDSHDIYQDRWAKKAIDQLYMFINRQARLDPKTLAVDFFERVEPVIESHVLKYAGYELTLPPDIENPHVAMETHHIVVMPFSGDEYVFQKKKPLHWKHAYKPPLGGYELGLFWWLDNKPVDPFSGKVVDWLALGQALACYNGLVWVKRGDRVFPVLYDAQTPDIMYFSDEKSVVVDHPVVDHGEWFQSRTQANTQFLIQDTYRGFSVLDLETGIVTEVENPQFELRARAKPEDCFFPGFVGEKFRVWCMEHKTVKRYYAETYSMREEQVESQLNDE